jgi:hypothetical protein
MNEIQIPVTPSKRKVRVGSRVGSGSLKNYVCISKGTEVKRVKRQVGDRLVAVEGWAYAPRSLWKKEVREKGLAVKFVAPEVKEVKEKKKKIKTDKPRKSKENKA